MKQVPELVTFGEVLWDIFPQGSQLGGAPFNVAAHFKLLGGKSKMISAVGQDELGSKIIREGERIGVGTELIQINPGYATGTVQVRVDSKGQPAYEILSPVAWDYIELSDAASQVVSQADALVFGTLACRWSVSQSTLFSFLPRAKMKVLDLNIRQNYYSRSLIDKLLQQTDLLKLNDEEWELLGKMYQKDPLYLSDYLMSSFGISLIIVTLGANGAQAFTPKQKFRAPGVAVQVVNTVGSGDAFLAAFLYHYLRNEPVQFCLEQACGRGALVATRSGAIF